MNKKANPPLLLLFILFLSQFSAFSQLHTNFYPGTVLLKNGQTLNGFIKGDPMSQMNYKINFKNTVTDKDVVVYDTSSIAVASLSNGEVYQFLRFKNEEMPDSMAVLGKQTLRGKVSLYKIYYDSKYVFLVKNDDKIYCLQDDEILSPTSVELVEHYFKNKLDSVFLHDAKFVTKINNLSFNEKALIDIISNYNTSVHSQTEVVKTKNEHSNFFIFGAGAGYKNSSNREVYLNAAYRAYFPRISKGTSLNIGINYYKGRYPSDYGYYLTKLNNYDLVSVPAQIQENLLNKNIRPYLFVGLNLSYYKVVDEFGVSQVEPGFQQNFGLGISFGGGIEVDIYKGLMVKCEYRYEVYGHPVLFGLLYSFKNK